MKKIAVLLSAAAISAFAGPQPKTHDGLFMSLGLGFGYGSFNDQIEGGLGELKNSGLQAESNVRIGYSIIENLALHATISVTPIYSDLETYLDGKKQGSISHDGFNTFLLGIGATYYIPNTDNFFASASFGISDYSVTFKDKDYEFDNLDAGFGFNLMAGKEWWVGDNMLLGAAFSYTHTSADGEYDDEKNEASTNSFSLLFTLSIN
ncbi:MULTISPECIES: autotransporter domain-containing protein [unclassified Fibrobacter]|uniref:autotransporter domain-containing protein n=1 Tax=unclassified Fibrobacter TaxID=2634177 RepID=UPI000D6AC355|nr:MULTISPECIES: autotransporter domain-containing protein [unclassified Fibrobacter]PWJ63700.1 outer membrane protein with beta-barrel domain [Fibrobacter sp. UWR4]PZW69088.1 outer membrane protein with beta-barrel domain [Fibrobacter sp. UWR1]